MNRDLYIDVAKGGATLSVIFIHTVFWSGQFYLPHEARVLSLLFDVPLFFLLSGLTSSGNLEKTFFRLLKLQITYMLFVALLFFLDGVYKEVLIHLEGRDKAVEYFRLYGEAYVPDSLDRVWNWKKLGDWFSHQYTSCDLFPVVMGSFWYLKTYFYVSFFGVLALRFFPDHIRWVIGGCVALILYFNFYLKVYPNDQTAYVIYYLAIFLLANQWKKGWNVHHIIYWGLATLMAYILMFARYGGQIFYKINKLKFPPRLPYIVWSFLSLFMVTLGYKRFEMKKQNLLTYIGQNAIFFYFAQGISSSLIYYIVHALKNHLHWGILMLFAFGLNLGLAIGIAWVLKRYDIWGWKQLRIFKKLTAI